MSKVTSFYRMLKSKSAKYLLFRTKYELERKSGLLARKFPTMLKRVKVPSLAEFRATNVKLQVPRTPSESLKKDTDRILQGEIKFFSDRWYALGLDYDWVTNPLTGYRYDATAHWTKINDYSKDAGDIKFVWEASRFCWLYTIVRNDYHNGEDHAEFVIGRILDWIERNPLNCGPNYKCSQETSLRVLNWLFALNYYKDCPVLSEDAWSTIITSIYWQIDHVYKNINFSRIAVRNNHAVTETLTLYIVGLLFPMFPDAVKWKRDGKRWFEEEIAHQFEPDGSYIQNSMNYQRVVVQLLTLGIALAERKGERFSDVVYDRAYACVNFLYQMQDERTGMLPNYGSNDGALFFPLSSIDYCDYRPQIDALYYVLTGKAVYEKRYEDSYWYGVSVRKEYPDLKRELGMVEFRDGGYYLISDEDSKILVRCGAYKGRCPTDQLHIDWWRDGENVLMDAGSYLYNTDEATLRYFSGTEGHNTVMIGDYDQMRKGMRFVWTNPSDILGVSCSETDDAYLMELRIKSFKYVDGGYDVKRTIRKKRGLPEIMVTDEIYPVPPDAMRQLWHTVSPERLTFVSDGVRHEKVGMFSRYYGRKEESHQIEFTTTKGKITTTIKIG